MQFNPGDSVSFVNEKLSGKIIKQLSPDSYLVLLDKDGFEIPVKSREIVLLHQNSSGNENKNAAQTNSPAPSIDKGLYIGIVRTQRSLDELHISFINHTDDTLMILMLDIIATEKYLNNFEINRNSAKTVKTIGFERSDELKNIEFHILRFNPKMKEIIPPLVTKFRFKENIIMKETMALPYVSEKGWLLPIINKEADNQPNIPQKEKLHPPVEKVGDVIDLHIENLIENTRGLSADSMLQIQYNHFVNQVEKAIAEKKESIIFIHGLGRGLLKQKIWDFATNHFGINTCEEAAPRKYGYGASRLIFAK